MASAAAGAAGSAGVGPGGAAPAQCDLGIGTPEAIWTAYQANPSTHPTLPNNSFAGYHYGEAALPSPNGPLIDVRTFGAKGDGTTDDTEAVRKAIASVTVEGGVVYFPDGTYSLSGPLFVQTDRTVLRGQSRAATRLVFSNSLKTGYATNLLGTKSVWSWAGGLIWFTPKSKNTYVDGATDVTKKFSESWSLGPELATITSPQQRGDTTITVGNASGLTPGRLVMLTIDNPADLSVLKHLTGGGAWADAYDWGSGNSGQVLGAPIWWPVAIAAVSGLTVSLRQPLRFELRAGWNPRLLSIGDTIRESGIENVTVVMKRDYKWSFAANHLLEPGWNGPWFNNAVDCFVRGVTVVDPDTAFGTSASKNVTFTDIELAASGPERIDHHHGTTTREYSNDILFEHFKITSKPWHGINVERFSMGNVWSNGEMEHGTFDTHRNLPYETVHTQITINNDGKRGGSGDAGPIMGARFANWNVDVKNGIKDMIGDADIMPSGSVIGVRGCSIAPPGTSMSAIDASGTAGRVPFPPNLYEAERALRLCPAR